MKRKGFTLVELLAVIVILSVISIITIPIIGNVIEESKKKALEVSVNGLVESANYYSINNEGTYEFLFDENHKGETVKGQSLDYNGSIDAEGKLYLDDEGNISICVYNDKYYAYKNYNSGIVVGDRKEDNCNIGYDVISNKYVAFLESEEMSSNVYSKEEVNNIIDGVENKITLNTNEITNIKGTITELQNNLSDYALQSSLDTTNSNLDSLSSIVNNNQNSINSINNKLSVKAYAFASNGEGDYALRLKDINGVLYIDGAFQIAPAEAWERLPVGSVLEWNHPECGDNFELANTIAMNGTHIRLFINKDGSVYLATAGASTSSTWVAFRNAYAYN